MSRLFNTPIELRAFDPDYSARVISDLETLPRAYVKIIDTDSSETTLATCSRFSATMSRQELTGTFTCSIEKARDWNPRTTAYADLLEPDKRKRIVIYYGQVLSGVITYVKVFTGILTKNPEAYSFGNSDLINLSGVGLAYLLLKANGTYVTSTFNGASKTLIEYWCDQAGIDHSLSYTDTITFTGQTIGYNNALAGLTSIQQVIGPDTEAYFDSEGRFIWRDRPTWNDDQVEFAYTQSNVIGLDKETDASKVITVAEITGIDADAVSTQEASAALINTYGRNRRSISSGLIATAAVAQALGTDYLSEGARWINPYRFSAILNPHLTVGSLLTIVDSTLATISQADIRINSLTHNYQAGAIHTTEIEALAN